MLNFCLITLLAIKINQALFVGLGVISFLMYMLMFILLVGIRSNNPIEQNALLLAPEPGRYPKKNNIKVNCKQRHAS